MALKVIEKETQADNLELRLRNKHIQRLANNQCKTEAGSCIWTHWCAWNEFPDRSNTW